MTEPAATTHAEHLTQQHGFFHAGVSRSLADTAGGYAGFSLFPANSSVLTVLICLAGRPDTLKGSAT